MVDKKKVVLALWIVFFCSSFALAQVAEISEDFYETSSMGYQYVIDKQGNPVYSQELSWVGDPYALEYEVTVFDSTGEELVRTREEGTSLILNLSPGEYTYNIVTFNLLEQAESETGLQSLQILRAEMPEISGVSPGFIFMDSFNALVTIQGKRLEEGSRIVLHKRGKNTGRGIEGVEQSRDGESELIVEFPMAAYVPGLFDISVINPGGLYAKKTGAIRIMYQRPVDILVSAGYSPIVVINDSWVKANWNESPYWLGANASLSIYFLKKSWGYLGLGVDITAHRLTGGIEMAKITSDYLLPGLNVLYKYRLNQMFHLLARAGAGVYISNQSFDYEGDQGPEDIFSGMSAQGGLAVQVFLPYKMHIEIGADWVQLFAGENSAGLIRPALKVGYQLF